MIDKAVLIQQIHSYGVPLEQAHRITTEIVELASHNGDINVSGTYFVEGMMIGAISGSPLLKNTPGGWSIELTNDERGIHAMYFISPSGLKWRVKASLEGKVERI